MKLLHLFLLFLMVLYAVILIKKTRDGALARSFSSSLNSKTGSERYKKMYTEMKKPGKRARSSTMQSSKKDSHSHEIDFQELIEKRNNAMRTRANTFSFFNKPEVEQKAVDN